ncbi:peptidyl-prolyl cis-trans isomerase [Anaeromyxobacter terrae]|uniref:peptidyl-prolyl cis-trans isomerase n=1 Tax=Anaeromyxobacter terrae TaxID=2925406 RepID=UPI001F580BB3|nr:peptidyl-prolyl cis-trans isomerase [Anaeromyxobacter sp. SG22]
MSAIPFLCLAVAALAGGEVIGKVGEVPLSRAAYEERADALRTLGQPSRPDDVVASLVDEVLLAEDARREGLDRAPELKARLDSERRRIVGDAFVERSLGDALDPPEAELQAAFHATADFARLQLLFYGERTAATEAAARLRAGGALAEEARRAAVAQVTPGDADAPLLMRSQLSPALASAVFQARAGAVVGPVEVPEGLAIAKVVSLDVGDAAAYQARRGALRARARQQVLGPARQHVAENLRAHAKVTVDEAFLRSTEAREPAAAADGRVIATVLGQPLRYRDILVALRSLAERGAGRHVSGAQVKIDAAWREVDARLLEHAAVERGVAAAPEVRERLAMTERGVLAAAAAQRLLRPASRGEDAERRMARVRARLERLRAEIPISVDRAALAAGAGAR